MSKRNATKVNQGRFAVMRDLQDHLIAGKLNFFDLGIYTAIHWQADFKTGVWWGSAPKLHAIGPSGFTLRYVQRSIQKLTRIGFLKPFRAHGRRGNYPVLINKYLPLSGALRNFRLNAVESTDWRNPKYEPCALRDTERDTEQPPIHNAVSSNQDAARKQNPAAKPAPPADPRHQLFYGFSYEAYRKKTGQPPTWGARETKNLQQFLKDNHWVTLEEWGKRFDAYLHSTDHYTGNKGDDSLLYFILHFDLYRDGPVLEKRGSNGNGKLSAEERIRQGDIAAANFLRNNRGVAPGVRPSSVPAKPEPETVN